MQVCNDGNVVHIKYFEGKCCLDALPLEVFGLVFFGVQIPCLKSFDDALVLQSISHFDLAKPG